MRKSVKVFQENINEIITLHKIKPRRGFRNKEQKTTVCDKTLSNVKNLRLLKQRFF